MYWPHVFIPLLHHPQTPFAIRPSLHHIDSKLVAPPEMWTRARARLFMMAMGAQQHASVRTMKKNRTATSTSPTASGVARRVRTMLKNIPKYSMPTSSRLRQAMWFSLRYTFCANCNMCDLEGKNE